MPERRRGVGRKSGLRISVVTVCRNAAAQSHVQIGKENYYLGAGGILMPAKKGQSPPDLKYFKDSQK